MASSTPRPDWYANCRQSWACCTWGLRRLRMSHSNVFIRCEVSITGLCVETFDGPHTFPDLPHVVFPQLLLHLYRIAVLGFLHIVFHLMPCCFLLPVEAILDFPCGPATIDRFNRGDHICTEVLVMHQAVCHLLHVLTMRIQSHISDCGVKAVSQRTFFLRGPSPN